MLELLKRRDRGWKVVTAKWRRPIEAPKKGLEGTLAADGGD